MVVVIIDIVSLVSCASLEPLDPTDAIVSLSRARIVAPSTGTVAVSVGVYTPASGGPTETRWPLVGPGLLGITGAVTTRFRGQKIEVKRVW